MKFRWLLAFCFAGSVLHSQAITAPTSRTSGQCSVSHTGNYDTITVVNNCGIGEQQGRKIESLLKDVLSNDGEANSKLDELLRIARAGSDRKLTEAQKQSIDNFLRKDAPGGFSGVIKYTSEREAPLYGNEFESLLKTRSWPVELMAWAAVTDPSFGLSVDINEDDKQAPPLGATVMITFFESIGIPCRGQYGMVDRGHYALEVGLKPVSNQK